MSANFKIIFHGPYSFQPIRWSESTQCTSWVFAVGLETKSNLTLSWLFSMNLIDGRVQYLSFWTVDNKTVVVLVSILRPLRLNWGEESSKREQKRNTAAIHSKPTPNSYLGLVMLEDVYTVQCTVYYTLIQLYNITDWTLFSIINGIMFCYVNVGRHIIASRQAPTVTQANYR